MRRRYLQLTLVIGLFTLFLLAFFGTSWRSVPRTSTPGGNVVLSNDQGEDEKVQEAGDNNSTPGDMSGIEFEGDPNAWQDGREKGQFKEPKVDVKSPYPIGTLKPPGSNYTRVLVMPKLAREYTKWIQDDLGDMIESGLLKTAVYTMDDRKAPLHPIKNKGREVMAYLSYIIDWYDNLPDIVICMHSHQYARHNNVILDDDAALMIRHLSPERVTRDGYMNLRCHWDPGCPEWIHPGETKLNEDKREQAVLAEAWSSLFPRDKLPYVLAQPCCAQFAVSRERINAIPKSRFVWLRDWIIRTDLDDYLSGRVFEYTWQYIFTSSPIHCPSMSACYCDGYGLCFGTPKNFDYYFELRYNLHEAKAELFRWNVKASNVEYAHNHAKEGRLSGEERLEVPEVGRDIVLKEEISRLQGEMDRMVEEAFERGKDPKQRALEAGREWKEGDGF